MMRIHRLMISAAFVSATLPLAAGAQTQMFPPQFRDIGIDQHLGARLPLDAEFRDQSGMPVHLRDYFVHRPVLLLPVYFTCPTLCGAALRGLVEGISALPMRPGKDFDIVAFSFNPDETVTDARRKANESMLNYAGRRDLPGWHFLTGSPASIAALTQAIGFHYRYDPEHKLFVHPSAMVIATPDGLLSRYLFGVTYQPRDLQQGILAAAHGQMSWSSKALRLLCYPFASTSGRFNSLALLMLRCTALALVVGLGVGLATLWRNDIRISRSYSATKGKA